MQLGQWRCFLTCHRGGGAGGGDKYGSVSRLRLLIGNKWMSRLQDHCFWLSWNALIAHCTRDGGGALSETVPTVSLSTVPRLYRQSFGLRVRKRTCGGGRAVSCVHAGIK